MAFDAGQYIASQALVAAEEAELWGDEAGQTSSSSSSISAAAAPTAASAAAAAAAADEAHQLVDKFWFVHDNVRLSNGRNVTLFGP